MDFNVFSKNELGKMDEFIDYAIEFGMNFSIEYDKDSNYYRVFWDHP